MKNNELELWIETDTLPRYGENTARLMTGAGRTSGRKASAQLRETEAQLDDSYQDSKKISKAYKDAVLWAATNGFINAEDGFLKPKASVTRGEMAHALHVYMEYSQG